MKKMKQFIQKTALLSIIVATMFACKPDEPIQFSNVTINVEFPNDYIDSKNDVVIQWENIANKTSGEVKTNNSGKATVKIEHGNYNFFASKKSEAIYYQGKIDNYAINSETIEVTIKLSASKASSTWVIKEVYFTGSKTPADKNYFKDQYIEIYNNSDETLYADGLIFCKTYDNTALENNWGQYKEKNEIVPSFIFQVPGSGKEHPVAPGKSIILADQGLNHKLDTLNPNSPVDMSIADFEWYDDHKLDIDVPEVPNLIKYYSSSASISMLHTRGYEGYYIFQMPVAETQAFLDAHPATTTMPNGTTKSSYAIPAKYIIDAVQCAEPSGYTSTVFPASLDAGYTYCDAAYIGKCVQRKFEKEENGRAILKDSNNSTNDFTPNATPSPRVIVK